MANYLLNDDGYEEPTYNAVTITQTVKHTIKVGKYHDEDEADELAEDKGPADLIGEAAFLLKDILDGNRPARYKIQRMYEKLLAIDLVDTDTEAFYDPFQETE